MKQIYAFLAGSATTACVAPAEVGLRSAARVSARRSLQLCMAALLIAAIGPRDVDAQIFSDMGAGLEDVRQSASALGDIDDDGSLDLVVVGNNGSSSSTTIYHNADDAGGFSSIGAGLQGVQNGDVCLGDFDQDGDLDLFLSGDDGDGSPFSKLYENTGDGSQLASSHFSSSNSVDLTDALDTNCAVGDMDGDGDPDLIFSGEDGNFSAVFKILRNDYNGSSLTASDFTDVTPSSEMTAGANSELELADFEDDGDLEVLIVGEGFTEATTLYKNTDDNNTLEASDFGSGLGTGLTDVDKGTAAIGDLDGDGDLDVIVSGDKSFAQETHLHENTDSDGTLDASDLGSSVGSGSIFPGATLGSIEIGNLDSDSDPDILIAGASNTSLYSNDKDSDYGTAGLASDNFTEITNDGFQEEVGTFAERSSANLGDFTGDNKLDVIVTGIEQDNSNPTAIAYMQANPIPVELVSFTAQQDGNRARLTWRTASETNNTGFAVQRKAGGVFKDVGFVDGAGTTNEGQTYRFRTDRLGAGTHSFRLKQVDNDGSATYSDPTHVQIGIEGTYRLVAPSPNPTSETATLQFAVKERQHVEVTVYDLLGRTVRTAFNGPLAAEQQHTLRLGSGLSAGTYLVQVKGEGFSATERLTIAR